MNPLYRRRLKWLGLALAVLLVVLALGVGGFLGTQPGSRWLLARVPGLQVEGFVGRLGTNWSAAKIVWQQDTTRVELDDLRFGWSPACLLRLTLCVKQLQVGQLDVQLPSGGDSTPGDVQLPALSLPLAVQLDDLQIGVLRFDGVEELGAVQLTGQWSADGLRIDTLSAQHQALSLTLHGTVLPAGDWPLSLDGQLDLPAPDQQPWKLALTVTGTLRNSLDLRGVSSGYLAGTLNGAVQPMREHLPAQLHLSVASFQASAGLPATLNLEQLDLSAQGDLASGYRVQGHASLPAEGAPITLALQGQVDAAGARIDALDLTAAAPADAQSQNPAVQQLHLSAQLDWRETFSADTRLQWQDFPWQRLFPGVEPPPVRLQKMNAELYFSNEKYLGNFSADLDGPAGAFTLLSPFSGDLTSVHLPQLQMQAGKGTATGSLDLDFAAGVAWKTRLDLSAIDPAYWLAELPGTLGGTLSSQGQVKDDQLQVAAQLDITGRLRNQPAVLQLNLDAAEQRWNLSNLNLRLGDNRIQGRGSLQRALSGQFELNLAKLAQLWPGLQGALDGQVSLAGTLKAPQGQINLHGQQLQLQDNRVQRIELLGSLDAAQRGNLSLKASGLAAGAQTFGVLTVSAQGDRQRQQLQANLDGPQLVLALGVKGGFERSAWRGRLLTGEVRSGGQDWRLQAPAAIERLAAGQLNLAAQCWVSGTASLCSDDQRLLPDPRVRVHLKGFPLASLAPWMPADFAWQGALNGELQLDLPSAGPKGQLSLDASNGTLRVRDKGQWLDFPYQALTLSSSLTPRNIDSRLTFNGGKLGDLAVQVQIDPRAARKPLSGEFRLQGLDISLARPFLPMVEHLSGLLSGNGRLAGTLLAPQVTGNLNLADGEISGAELPVSFEKLKIQAAINGQSLRLQGDWQSGAHGTGQLSGTVDWAPTVAVNVSVQGTRLPITVEPYAELEAEPDLRLQMAGDKLAISGKVLIPRGAITVRELPPSTVKVSDDAVIVGRQVDSSAPITMAMDINVEVGQDKLTFSGFGLNANLLGHVHIGNDLDTRGELSLANGRYRAYGQNLTIRRARLLFAGPIDQPYLDIEAVRTTDDIVAGIRLTGNAEQPNSQVFSEPAMSQEQALSYLVLGRPLTTTGDDNNVLAQAALGLGLAGSAGVTSKLAGTLGIEDFQLDTQGSGATTSVVASGNLSERLTLRYGVGVFDPVNTIALRYALSKRLYLEAASGLASSLDIFYKRDF